jgi:Uma2 family endonuclease
MLSKTGDNKARALFMATVTHLTVAEYLRRHDEPECELIAGELIAKPMGTIEHMRMERRLQQLVELFDQRGKGHVVWERPFLRGDEVRIPDVVFLASTARFEDGILVDAPLLCVEILSPSQRETDLFAKCEVYHAWGVPHCWGVDPIGRKAWEYHHGWPVSLLPGDGTLRAGEIAVSVSDLFE